MLRYYQPYQYLRNKMAYEIKIKSLKEPIRVENHGPATRIKESWERFMLHEIDDAMVTIAGWTGTLGSIVFFREIASSNASSARHDEDWRKTGEDFIINRNIFLKLSSEEKGKKLDFFRMIYWGFTQRKSENIMAGDVPIEEYAQDIQSEFFRKNPKRMLCDPAEFKKIIKSSECHSSVSSIIEGAILQDMKLAQ